jgi:hypothetical protein
MSNNNEAVRLQLVAKAADAFSLGDIVNRSIRQHQNWSLMPFGATVGSVLPATYMRGSRETFYNENNFPRSSPPPPSVPALSNSSSLGFSFFHPELS